jgi:hypothetical protein
MLSIVHVPTEEEESVRSLVRCRITFKRAVAQMGIEGTNYLKLQS